MPPLPLAVDPRDEDEELRKEERAKRLKLKPNSRFFVVDLGEGIGLIGVAGLQQDLSDALGVKVDAMAVPTSIATASRASAPSTTERGDWRETTEGDDPAIELLRRIPTGWIR